MSKLAELERDVWDQIKIATERHDATRLEHFSKLAADIDSAKKDWVLRLDSGLKMNGRPYVEGQGAALKAVREPAVRPVDDFTGRPVRGFEFEGVHVSVYTYKELLLQFTNLLRKKFGAEFDRCALRLGGRKRRYFSRHPRELKYAQELESGGLFVETNLNANLLMKICHSLLRELGCNEAAFKVF